MCLQALLVPLPYLVWLFLTGSQKLVLDYGDKLIPCSSSPSSEGFFIGPREAAGRGGEHGPRVIHGQLQPPIYSWQSYPAGHYDPLDSLKALFKQNRILYSTSKVAQNFFPVEKCLRSKNTTHRMVDFTRTA